MKTIVTAGALALALIASAGSALACKSGCDCCKHHHHHHHHMYSQRSGGANR